MPQKLVLLMALLVSLEACQQISPMSGTNVVNPTVYASSFASSPTNTPTQVTGFSPAMDPSATSAPHPPVYESTANISPTNAPTQADGFFHPTIAPCATPNPPSPTAIDPSTLGESQQEQHRVVRMLLSLDDSQDVCQRHEVRCDSQGSVVVLDMAYRGLISLPPEIRQLQSLQNLRLTRNQLTSLPPEIGQLQSLQILDLDLNQLNHLPPEIGQLQSLQTLFLAGNQLTYLPPEIGQIQSLQTLLLNGNQLTYLPPEVAKLSYLRYLNLNANPVTSLPPEICAISDIVVLPYELCP